MDIPNSLASKETPILFADCQSIVPFPLNDKKAQHPLLLEIESFEKSLFIKGCAQTAYSQAGHTTTFEICSMLRSPHEYRAWQGFGGAKMFLLLSNDKVLVSENLWCRDGSHFFDDDFSSKINSEFRVLASLSEQQAASYEKVYSVKGNVVTLEEKNKTEKHFNALCRRFYELCIKWDPRTCPIRVNEFRMCFAQNLVKENLKYVLICRCGFPARTGICRSGKNVGMHYCGCPFYLMEGDSCTFFEWLNPAEKEKIDHHLSATKKGHGSIQKHGGAFKKLK